MKLNTQGNNPIQREKDETPKEYFFRMLMEGRLSFTELTEIYVTYLEVLKKENQRDIAEASVLVSILEKPKLWMGTKKELSIRIKDFLKKTGIFNL